MDLLLGLDVGTSAIKGLLVSVQGEVLGQAQRTVRYSHPEPGFRELDAQEHYRDLCAVLRACARQIPSGGRVRALSMAAASGNTLLLDGRGKPLAPIVSWMDRRAAGKRAETLPGFDYEGVHAVCGWPWSDGFPLAMLAWLRHDRPALFAAARRFCMNSDYLFYRLTGRWGMDPSTATTFYLADQVKRRWHEPTLHALDIPAGGLSELRPSGTPLGPLTAAAATATGLSPDTLVVLGAFDHPCAARGVGALAAGDLLLSCGTSWVGCYVLAGRAQALQARLLIDPFLNPPGPWAAMFSLPYVGQSVEWYATHALKGPQAAPAKIWERFNALAEEAPPGAGGLCLHPFFDRLRNRPLERTSFSTSTPPACIARAVMEGLAYEMRRKIEHYRDQGIAAAQVTMVGGPSESPLWPQLLSDITGLQLRLSSHGRHAGALGAALLAGIGAGIFRDEAHGWQGRQGGLRELHPDPERQARYQPLYQKYLAYSEGKALH